MRWDNKTPPANRNADFAIFLGPCPIRQCERSAACSRPYLWQHGSYCQYPIQLSLDRFDFDTPLLIPSFFYFFYLNISSASQIFLLLDPFYPRWPKSACVYDMSSGETISWLPQTLSLPAIGVPRLFSNFRCPGVRPCRKPYFLEAAFRLIFHFQLSILGDMRYFWGIRVLCTKG